MHTYTLINKEGRVTYVKFHWQPALGEHPLPLLACCPCLTAALVVSLLLNVYRFWCVAEAYVESAKPFFGYHRIGGFHQLVG